MKLLTLHSAAQKELCLPSEPPEGEHCLESEPFNSKPWDCVSRRCPAPTDEGGQVLADWNCPASLQRIRPEPFDRAWSKRLPLHHAHDARSIELELQMLDLLAHEFHQVAFQAASGRTPRHLNEFSRQLAVFDRAASRNVHVAELGLAQFELLRLIAIASGRAFAMGMLGSFRPYFLGPAGTVLFPPEVWRHLWTALVDRDARAMSEAFQRCFDRRNAFLFSRLDASWPQMGL